MKINISAIQASVTTRQGPKTSYQQLELAFKNLDTGKVESKKIMSFTNEAVYKALSGANSGDLFVVTSEKNDKSGYWDWTSVEARAPGSTPEPVRDASPRTTGATTIGKSTYETPEERAKKQVYIVRQSAIAQSVALLSVGAKVPPSTELVLGQAQEFVDWVFAEKQLALIDMPNDIIVD